MLTLFFLQQVSVKFQTFFWIDGRGTPGTVRDATRFEVRVRSHSPRGSRGIRYFSSFCQLHNGGKIFREVHHQIRTGCLNVVREYFSDFVTSHHAGISICKRS